MKKVLVIFLGLVAVLTAGIAIFLLTFDLNSYRYMITDRLTETLGRPVSIAQLETKLSLIPTIKIRGIQIDNPEGFSNQNPFVKIDSAEATLAIAPLLYKRAEIQKIVFNDVQVWLMEQRGHRNWDFEKIKNSGSSETGAKDEWKIRLDDLGANQVTINYKDLDRSKQYVFSDFSLKQLRALAMNIQIGKHDFKIKGNLDDLMKLLEKKDYLFNLEITGLDSVMRLSGSIGDINTLKDILLNVDISGTNLKQTLQQVGLASVEIPAQAYTLSTVLRGDLDSLNIAKADFVLGEGFAKVNLSNGSVTGMRSEPVITAKGQLAVADLGFAQTWGIRPFAADFEMTASAKEIDVKQFVYRANRSDLQIAGKIRLEEKPVFNLLLASEYLNTHEILVSDESERSAASHQTGNKVISDKTVDLSVLNSFNGQFEIKIPRLQLSDDMRGILGFQGRVDLQDGVLSSDQFRINVLNGTAVSQFRIQARQDQSFNLKLNGQGFSLDDIKAFNGIVDGALVDANIDITTAGNRVQTLLKNLNGTIVLEIPQGTITNPWFNDLIEKLNVGKKRSMSYSITDQLNKILCGAIAVTIKDGRMTSTDKIALETSNISFLIGGEVDLPTEKVSLTMRPFLNQMTQTNLDLIMAVASQAIHFDGTFNGVKPSIVIDEGIAKTFLQSISQTPQPYQLCEKALGRKTKKRIMDENRKAQVLQIPEPTPVVEPQPSAQDQFKQQLLESLNQMMQ